MPLSRLSRLFLLLLLSIGLGYAVFEDGGVLTWGWNVCLLIAGLVSVAYWILTPANEPTPPLGPWVEKALFLLPAYVVFQLVPLPFFLLKILSPARARLTENLAAVMPRPEFVPFSVAPSTTDSYLLRLAGYLIVFLFVREITRRTRHDWPWISFAPLIVIGVLEALLGLSQSGAGTDVTGTYANKNHFAGLLEMILPGTIACGITFVKAGDGPLSLPRTLAGGALFAAAASMFVAIVYSLSKMGFAAALCGLLAMVILAAATGRSTRTKSLAVAGLVAILLGAFVFLPSDQVINGLGNLSADNTAEGRISTGHDTLRLLADYPFFGSGLGTYGSAFIQYQTSNGDVAFINAHNDYLQLLAELGLLGFILLAGWVAPTFIRACRTAITGPGLNTRYMALGCVGGMVAIGVHSLADFNLYIPANAMVLVWIAGITAGLSPESVSLGNARSTDSRFPVRSIMLALSCVVIVFATGWLVYEAKFRGISEAERWFCRFGICDIDSVLAAETAAPQKNPEPALQPTLWEAVSRDPSTPGRWSDLGDSLYRSGQLDKARRCFSNALALGPHVPPILLDAAEFYQQIGEEDHALELTSRALAQTVVFASPIFDWFEAAKLPVPHVLAHGLPQQADVYRAYLRFVKDHGETGGTKEIWNDVLSHGYADDSLARDYVNWVYGRGEYEAAAEAWAAYLGDRGQGYLTSNRIFNGDFESEISQLALDWSINTRDGIEIERDGDTKHSGKYSLRIRLAGKDNLTSLPVSQRAVVAPALYRFEAYLKTQDLSTDQGISLHLSDPEGTSHLNVTTVPLLGTNDWRKFSAEICVMPPTKLIAINLVRRASLKFDSLIKGTFWIDSVSLSKLRPNCL